MLASAPSQVTCLRCGAANKPAAAFCRGCGVSLLKIYRPLEPGQRLRNYLVQRLLSKGGMGAIYLAKDLDVFGRTVVIKELLDYFDPRDPQAAQAAHERFKDEARTLAGLRHTGIPQIYTFFSLDASNYIVMEYIEGQDLLSGLTRNAGGSERQGTAYPVADVLRWGSGLCRVLEYLATRQPMPVVHHDIKPANVVLDANTGEVRLVDFGTAKARLLMQAGGTVGLQKSSIYGTAGYAPPEQYGGRSEPRSDVYALAATLYHLATDDDPSDHPFSFPELTRLPAALADALAPALRTDVTQRPSASELRAALDEARQAPTTTPFRFENEAPPAAPRSTVALALPIDGAALRMAMPTWVDREVEAAYTLDGHKGGVTTLAWSPNGQILAAGARDGIVRFWGTGGSLLRTLEGHSGTLFAVAWNPSGHILASAAVEDQIRLWSWDGSPRGILPAPIFNGAALTWSPDGHKLAALCSSAFLYTPNDGSYTLLRDLPSLNTAAAWSPDGSHLATGSADGQVRLWNAAGHLVRRLAAHQDAVSTLAWSPDGTQVASGGRDNMLRLSGADGTARGVFKQHPAYLTALAWHPDGRTLASASADGTLRLWQADGTSIGLLTGHADGITALTWHPDGRTLASASDDGTIRLWNVGGSLRVTLRGHSDAVTLLAWSPGGQTLASGSWDGTIQLWRLVGNPHTSRIISTQYLNN